MPVVRWGSGNRGWWGCPGHLSVDAGQSGAGSPDRHARHAQYPGFPSPVARGHSPSFATHGHSPYCALGRWRLLGSEPRHVPFGATAAPKVFGSPSPLLTREPVEVAIEPRKARALEQNMDKVIAALKFDDCATATRIVRESIHMLADSN